MLLPDWYFSAVTAFFFLSLGVNTLATGLIIYKIVTVYREIQELKLLNASNVLAIGSASRNGQPDLYPLISILIESGLMTFVGQLIQSIMYKTAGPAFALVAGCVVMLYVRASRFASGVVISFITSQGISTTIVLVRVELGITYDHNTSRSENSRHGSIHWQPAPIASNPNHTTTIDVEVPDVPNDTRSVTRRKIVRPN